MPKTYYQIEAILISKGWKYSSSQTMFGVTDVWYVRGNKTIHVAIFQQGQIQVNYDTQILSRKV